MKTIDVHDLPEPVAQAIAAMVESVRRTVKSPTPQSANGEKPTLGEILKPILDAAAALPREPGPPYQGQESEIAQGVVEKFKRQGLAAVDVQTAADFDRLLDEFFEANPEPLPLLPTDFSRTDIYSDHD